MATNWEKVNAYDYKALSTTLEVLNQAHQGRYQLHSPDSLNLLIKKVFTIPASGSSAARDVLHAQVFKNRAKKLVACAFTRGKRPSKPSAPVPRYRYAIVLTSAAPQGAYAATAGTPAEDALAELNDLCKTQIETYGLPIELLCPVTIFGQNGGYPTDDPLMKAVYNLALGLEENGDPPAAAKPIYMVRDTGTVVAQPPFPQDTCYRWVITPI